MRSLRLFGMISSLSLFSSLGLLGALAIAYPASSIAADRVVDQVTSNSRTLLAAHSPTIQLVAAARQVSIPQFGGQVLLDPSVWVASLGSALEFEVQRVTYSQPVTITQIVHLPSGGTRVIVLPRSVLDGFNGLRDFLGLTVRNPLGKIVAHGPFDFCPDTFDPERANPDSPATSPYPVECISGNPFQKATVWGIAKGWAADPFQGGPTYNLALGTYHVTVAINRPYLRLLHINPRNASTSVTVKVVQPTTSPLRPPTVARAQPWPLRSLPANVPDLTDPPSDTLPDLVAMPSWGISTSHTGDADLLNFGATVWIGGESPLDVEGFRSNGSPVMKAYQYFWRNGHVIGRVRVGTMGFADYNHWHFEQFARYVLLNAARNLAVRSHKEGFCIAPTDGVDLLLSHAVWQPTSIGLSGQCGVPTALSVQEYLPVGWGDTYFQSVVGQSFNITNLPNGTYYIEIIANPLKVLYESNMNNDVSLRRVILAGAPGHRTVRVPAWNGIDPEN